MYDGTTMCIVHAGFSGFRAFVARKKNWCKLIGNRFVIPHDTIHSTLWRIVRDCITQLKHDYKRHNKRCSI